MSKHHWQYNPDKIILFDNGAYEIKHSTANTNKTIKKHQNCKFYDKPNNMDSAYFIENIKENYPIENISNINKNYNRPISRGLLFDLDLELEIWERILTNYYSFDKTEINLNESLFVFTHTPFAPDEIIDSYFQLIFEYFNFNACVKSIPHIFSAMFAKAKFQGELNPTVQLVVDSGFSSTTIVPIFDNRPVTNAIKRIDIGGKLITNYLKEALVNTIELDIRKEFYLVNLIKEENLFTSKNFNIDMKIASFKGENNLTKKTFILPEYRRKSEDQLKKLAKEKYAIEINALRFIPPELIFRPNMIGLDEGGLHQGIIKSADCCHRDYKNLLFENIILTGGNSKLDNFKERLHNEITPLIDNSTTNLKIFDLDLKTSEPVIEGMKLFCRNIENIKSTAIFKAEYEEIGYNVIWKNCL